MSAMDCSSSSSDTSRTLCASCANQPAPGDPRHRPSTHPASDAAGGPLQGAGRAGCGIGEVTYADARLPTGRRARRGPSAPHRPEPSPGAGGPTPPGTQPSASRSEDPGAVPSSDPRQDRRHQQSISGLPSISLLRRSAAGRGSGEVQPREVAAAAQASPSASAPLRSTTWESTVAPSSRGRASW